MAAWAFYKPTRVLAPELAGVACVSEVICLDDVSRYEEAAELYNQAYAFVNSSLGAIDKKPRIIFCASAACFQSFGFNRAAAHTVGKSGIVIGPRGWKDYYLRHEMIHHLQAERMGVFRQVASYAQNWCTCRVEGGGATLVKWGLKGLGFSGKGEAPPTFATMRLRTVKTRNCLSVKTALSLIHQPAMSVQKRWRWLRGFGQLADLVAKVKFVDRIDEREIRRKAA